MKDNKYHKLPLTEPIEAIQLETLRPRHSQETRPYSNEADIENDADDSDSSVTSQIFADINDFSKNAHTEETFEDDAGFQRSWNSFKLTAVSSRLLLSLSALFCLLLWTVFLIVYSNGNAKQKATSLWHGSATNIVELSHRNISLNSFDPNNKNASFTDSRKGLYTPSFGPIRWLQNAQFPASQDSSAKGYYVTRYQDKLVVRSADSNYEKTVLDSNQFSYQNRFFHAQDVILNPGDPVDNPSAIHLLRSDSVQQWRHSSFSLFWLWKPVSGEVFPIQPPSQAPGTQLEKLSFAQFDPSGNMLVFGYERNLYLLNVSTREISTLTDSGNKAIFNGKPDWVYEEEVFPQDHMIWWSPDSKRVVYAQINDTEVESYDIEYYVKGPGEAAMSYEDKQTEKKKPDFNQYPHRSSVKYPKPGTPNPKVRLFSYTPESNSTLEISGLSDDTVKDDFLLYDATWIDPDNFLLKVSDRFSSVLTKKFYQPKVSNTAQFISLQNASDYNGWIEKASPNTLVKKNGRVHYLDRVVENNIVHLALFDSASSAEYKRLLGPVNSDSLLSYDALENCVYGIFGTDLNSSFASVSLDDGNMTILATGGDYGLNFSPNGQFLELRFNGPTQPWRKVLNLALVAVDGNYIHDIGTFDDSARLSTVLSNTNIPTRILSSVRVGHGSDHINMIEIFPPNFKREEKHPLLVHVYGGPGSMTVNKAFGVDFQDIVSSQLNAVVLIIDPRGTGRDDWKSKSRSKGNMGLWEPRDILAVTKDYIEANSYIDDQKTAIWGWSYGGFTTLKTLELDKGAVFKYGMAVAPVTNWLFYDSVFTERIMGSPRANANYDKVSQVTDFAAFKDVTRFLIMQGTADDNVHMQNSLWLMDNFDQLGVENYDVHFFPDSDHSIYYHNANTIVYDKLMWWLEKAFGGVFA